MQTPKITLEICIESLQDAIIAQQSGAHRVELNSALSLGGLTPTLGTLIAIKQQTTIKTITMIRPRPGGFDYSPQDFEVMQNDIALFNEHGVDGHAFGCLKQDGSIDLKRSKILIDQMLGKEIVFHRAFDVTPDPLRALEQLIDLGVHRILTSGQKPTAQEGAPLLKQLIEKAAGRIEILPASKITADSVKMIIQSTGCNQVHGSLRTTRPDNSMQANPAIAFSSTKKPNEQLYSLTSNNEIQKLLNQIQTT